MMSDLPIEKQLTHHQFCEQIADIRDRNVLIEMLKDLHIKYFAINKVLHQYLPVIPTTEYIEEIGNW